MLISLLLLMLSFTATTSTCCDDENLIDYNDCNLACAALSDGTTIATWTAGISSITYPSCSCWLLNEGVSTRMLCQNSCGGGGGGGGETPSFSSSSCSSRDVYTAAQCSSVCSPGGSDWVENGPTRVCTCLPPGIPFAGTYCLSSGSTIVVSVVAIGVGIASMLAVL